MANSIKGLQPSAVALRPTRSESEIASKVRAVSDLYEKQFLREMVKAMRQTVGSGGLIPENMGQKIFREQLDNEYVEAWGERGGVGLSDLIYDQLMQQVAPSATMRTVAPLPLTQIRRIETRPTNPSHSGSGSIRLQGAGPAPEGIAPGAESQTAKPMPRSGRLEVLAPHGGNVYAARSRGEGVQELHLLSPEGVHSRLLFKGVLLAQEIGDRVQEGQRLGWSDSTTWVQWDWETA